MYGKLRSSEIAWVHFPRYLSHLLDRGFQPEPSFEGCVFRSQHSDVSLKKCPFTTYSVLNRLGDTLWQWAVVLRS